MSHEMQREKTYQSGAELWNCPQCGRQMVIQWHPFKRITLKKGQERLEHSASKGGLKLESEINVGEGALSNQ
jgi:hypothetical protein